jgi:hypothetical protein
LKNYKNKERAMSKITWGIIGAVLGAAGTFVAMKTLGKNGKKLRELADELVDESYKHIKAHTGKKLSHE